MRLKNVMMKANGVNDSVGFVTFRHYRAPFQCAGTERRTQSRKIPIDAHSKMKGGAGRTLRRPTPLRKVIAQSDFIGFFYPSRHLLLDCKNTK